MLDGVRVLGLGGFRVKGLGFRVWVSGCFFVLYGVEDLGRIGPHVFLKLHIQDYPKP